MFPWEIGITIMMLPTTKMKGFIWVKAKSLYSAWFNLRFMQAPKKKKKVCEYFSFVKPWVTDDRI
jgi:hypothetical protein